MDNYIDQHETLAYGPFAVTQIRELVIGIDPAFDEVLGHVADLLSSANDAMKAALDKAGDVEVTTYASQGDSDPVAAARALLRRLVKYVESREDGDAMASDILNGETLTTVLRRRPVKLSSALVRASSQVSRYKDALPEYKTWTSSLSKSEKALDALNTSVRKSREERRAMTPAVTAARASWLTTYGAAKLLVECVLKLHGKTRLMSEIFDDLAEVHRVAGVTDESPPATPAPADPNAPATPTT